MNTTFDERAGMCDGTWVLRRHWRLLDKTIFNDQLTSILTIKSSFYNKR